MLFNVPQFIDVEDKVAGPLTAKQLGMFIGMGALLFVLWALLPFVPFVIVAIPIVLVFVAFAFYKPFGLPLSSFVFSGIMFLFKPKVYVWRRTPKKMSSSMTTQSKSPQKNKSQSQNMTKVLTQEEKQKMVMDNLKGIAKIVDSEGKENVDKKLVEILNQTKNQK